MLTVALEPISAEEWADVVDADSDEVTTTLRELRSEFARDRRGLPTGRTGQWLGPAVITGTSRTGWPSSPIATCPIDLVRRPSRRWRSYAYRQPISRAQITALRGVNVDGVSRLLEQRGYIEEVGRAGGPGQPILYGTTELFLDRMGARDTQRPSAH